MSYPKSKDKNIRKLSNILVKHAEQRNINYTFGGKDLYPVETFSHFGFLSLFLIEAKEMYEEVFNGLYPIASLLQPIQQTTYEHDKLLIAKDLDYLSKQPKHITFPIEFMEELEGTYLGFIPRVSTIHYYSDFSPLAHFTLYVVDNYENRFLPKNRAQNEIAHVPLDAIFEKVTELINNDKINIRSAPIKQPHTTQSQSM